MNLRLVIEPPRFSVKCYLCHETIGEREPKVADLEGPAFEAYYHQRCAERLAEAADYKPAENLCGDPGGAT